jgi:hypothetical protein
MSDEGKPHNDKPISVSAIRARTLGIGSFAQALAACIRNLRTPKFSPLRGGGGQAKALPSILSFTL